MATPAASTPTPGLVRESFYRKPGYNELLNYYLTQESNVFNNIAVGATYSNYITAPMLYYSLKKIILKYPSLLTTLEDVNEGRLNDLGPLVQVRPINKILFSNALVEFVNDYTNEVVDPAAAQNAVNPLYYDESGQNYYLQLFYQKIFKESQFDFNYRNGKTLWKLYVVNKLNRIIIVANPTLLDHSLLIQVHREFQQLFNDYHAKVNSANKNLMSIKSFEMNLNVAHSEFLSFNKSFNYIKKNLNKYATDYVDFKLPKTAKLKLKPLKLMNSNLDKLIHNFELNLFKKQYADILYATSARQKIDTKFLSDPQTYYVSQNVSTNHEFRLVDLDKLSTNLVSKICKQKGITINTLIILLFWIAVNKIHDINKFIRIEHSIDLRSYISTKNARGKSPGNNADAAFQDGAFTQYVKILIEPINDFSWDVVAQYQRYFDKILGSIEDIESNIEAFNYLVPPEDLLDYRINQLNENHAKDYFMTFSNAGMVKFDDSKIATNTAPDSGFDVGALDRYEIENMDYSISNNVLSGANIITMISTKKSGISFNIGSCDELILSRFDDTVEEFQKMLQGLATI